MEGSLLVTPEQLESTAGQFDSIKGQIQSLTADMMTRVRDLSASWQGEASTAFINKFGQLENDLQKMYSMIGEHVKDLGEMAAKYRQAETSNEEIAAALSGDVIS